MSDKLSAEQRVQKAHVSLMKNPKYCMYSGIFMIGKTSVEDNVQTACTNGCDTKYGREFLDDLEDKEVKGLILHENLHKAFRHLTVWQHLYKKWPQVANMACVVEGTLVTMADGSQRAVESVRGGEYVKSPIGDARVLFNTTALRSDIIELVLSTGHKLIMTADHKVLTDEGFYEAGQIKEGQLCAVDIGRVGVSTEQLRHHVTTRHGRQTGQNVFTSVRGNEPAGDSFSVSDGAQGSVGYGVLTANELNRLGISCGDRRRGGNHYGAVQQVLTPDRESGEYQLAFATEAGGYGVSLDASYQLERQKIFHHRDIGMGDRTIVSWDDAVLGDQETISEVAIRDVVDQEANAVQVQAFCKDVRDKGTYKGYQYARVTTTRRFTEERRVFDLTTTTQSFEANGVVTHNCDYVINLIIHDSDVQGIEVRLPKDGLLDEKFRGLDAGEVFRRLQKEADEKKSIHVKTVGDQAGRDVPVEDGNPAMGELDEHDWESAKGMSDIEREQLARDVDQALRQGALLAGKLNANMPRDLAELLKAKVDWREALREFISSFCLDRDESTWRRPSRRWIGQDVYMPSMIGESIGRIVLGIDMSGSIGPQEVGQFLGEVKHICETVKPEGIDLLYWDTRVCQHEKYERDQLDNLLASTKPRGGGGTAPSCITDYMKAHRLAPECAVILTDGYVENWGGTWPCPVLWGITSEQVAGVGKTVHVKD